MNRVASTDKAIRICESNRIGHNESIMMILKEIARSVAIIADSVSEKDKGIQPPNLRDIWSK